MSAVLTRDDVIDLERERRKALRELAVLASGSCPLPDKSRERLVHRGSGSGGCVLERAARLGAHQVEESTHSAVTLELGFLGAGRAAVDV